MYYFFFYYDYCFWILGVMVWWIYFFLKLGVICVLWLDLLFVYLWGDKIIVVIYIFVIGINIRMLVF